MSLVGKVGRKRPRARIAMVVLYAILSLGALTTLYPFALMASTGFKGPTDQNDNKLIPSYFRDDAELFTKYVDDKYKGDAPAIASTRMGPDASSGDVATYERFLMNLPLSHWTPGFQQAPNQVTGRLAIRYQNWLRNRYKTIEAMNVAYVEENTAFQTVSPPAEQPERKAWKEQKTRKYREWKEFKASLPAEYRVPVRVQRLWQDWMKSKHQAQFGQVPAEYVGTAKSFEELPLPKGGALWSEFWNNSLPSRFQWNTTEELWTSFLRDGKVVDLAKIDRSGVWLPSNLSSVPQMPIVAFEKAQLEGKKPEVRREFAVRNFGYVLDYILINGRAVFNTFFFCLLAITTQLIVNPLAAYALSHYPIRASGQILIFLLATMAFPAEVALIPSFLLLKDLGLLNTFAALVLPTAASGYMIFLLKGFFDSLPQELFEAGQLDGAKEVTMMTRIALPLSKPVLGYLALIAFMSSYGAFIYAFLVAQDQSMWTLMVWIYQLQSIAPKAVMMSALTLAAIPTLLVFLLAQRFIMRGIVLPGER